MSSHEVKATSIKIYGHYTEKGNCCNKQRLIGLGFVNVLKNFIDTTHWDLISATNIGMVHRHITMSNEFPNEHFGTEAIQAYDIKSSINVSLTNNLITATNTKLSKATFSKPAKWFTVQDPATIFWLSQQITFSSILFYNYHCHIITDSTIKSNHQCPHLKALKQYPPIRNNQ